MPVTTAVVSSQSLGSNTVLTSSSFAFNPAVVIAAFVTNGVAAPNTGASVSLQLSTDGGSTWRSVATKNFGLGFSQSYGAAFVMADYAAAAAYTHCRLVFTGGDGQAVTVSANQSGADIVPAEYADDAAAAAGGVAVGGFYSVSGVVHVRLS